MGYSHGQESGPAGARQDHLTQSVHTHLEAKDGHRAAATPSRRSSPGNDDAVMSTSPTSRRRQRGASAPEVGMLAEISAPPRPRTTPGVGCEAHYDILKGDIRHRVGRVSEDDSG